MPSVLSRALSAIRLAFGFRHAPDEESQMHQEMQYHVDRQTEKNIVAGMTPSEARRAALLTFGGMTRWHEEGRDEVRSAGLESVTRDLRFAARMLRAHPGFAIATIATVGLAIAAAVTAFGFVDSIFLRPLPVPTASRLVRLYLTRPGQGRYRMVGTGGVALLRAHPAVFDAVAADDARNVRFVRARGSLDQRFVSFISADFFPLMGLTPRLGRFFSRDEDAVPDRDAVAVISATLWHNAFAGDSGVIGEHVTIMNRDFSIVGIAPEGFEGVAVGEAPSQIWLPTMMMPSIAGGCSLHPPCEDSDVLARLAPGVTLVRAQAEVATLGRALSRLSMGDDSARTPIITRATGVVIHAQHSYRPLARLLGAIAAALLLIACANLSGLLLARGVSREREIAMRLALGASRMRIAQQLLFESLLIGLTGGALGVLLSIWNVRLLLGTFASDEEGFQRFFPLGLDWRVLLFAVAASLMATILFGLLPAWTSARAEVSDVLKNTGGGAPRGRARFGLIATQVALTSALLSAAGLLSRSFVHLLHSQRFDPAHVALFRVRPAGAQYEPERSQQYVRAVAERVGRLPDVESVAFARGSGLLWSSTPWDAGFGVTPLDSSTVVETHSVSPSFFATLRIKVDEGREFTERDGPGAAPVVIVSQSIARRLWPRGSALDHLGYLHGKAFRVVGVVPDYRVQMTGEPTSLMVFFPFWQNAIGPEKDARFAVRVRGDAAATLGALRSAAMAVDPGVPVAEVMTMSAQVDKSYPEVHLGQTVLIGAGSLALFLSAIGLYGMIAFLVARRTRDIGIRLALGAAPARVVLQFVSQGLRATVVGLAAGLAVALAGSQMLSGWLVGVPPRDVVAFGLAALAVLMASLVACVLPARRASHINPVAALRGE